MPVAGARWLWLRSRIEWNGFMLATARTTSRMPRALWRRDTLPGGF